MRVLKVEAEGLTTSFRYPHFMHGVHPTFEMPPPATIYGHICSALGDWVAPDGLRFAYRFTYEARFNDVEHIHVLTTAESLPRVGGPWVLAGRVNPFKREILFKPRLTLYLNKPEWEAAFKSPHYALVLGRSQDLFTYTSVSVVELELSNQAYFEHTLAPYRLALQGARGYAVLMPRFLDYANRRAPSFHRYVIIKTRVRSDDLLYFEGHRFPSQYVIDPDSPEYEGLRMGLFFHSFVGEEDDEALVLA